MRATSSNRVIGGLAALAAIAFVMGCGDPLSPGEVAGTYVLTAIGEDSLPVLISQGEPSVPVVTIIADTLWLDGDGRGSKVTIQKLVTGPDDGPGERVRSTSSLRFRTTGDRIEISYDCPPNASLANCAPGPHLFARQTSGGLTANNSPNMVQQELLTYERVK